jgi:molybdate transport system substrate-binding protein
VRFNFAGSNELAQQVLAARGMDLLLSASEHWMDVVERAGRVLPGSRRALLANRLVVVANARAPWRMATPCDLAALPFTHLALGDPQAVPAGTYAREWLQAQRCGDASLWQAVRGRVAPTPDVRAALGLVLADPGVAAVVYRTDALACAQRSRVLFQVEQGPAIRYSAAQLAEGDQPRAAARLLAFLGGPVAARIFARHGFIPLAYAP